MRTKNKEALETPPTIEEEASESFVQRVHGEWTVNDQAALEARLARDPAFADAYRRVEQSWGALSTHAEAPEVMACREEALVYARRANGHRWLKGSERSRSRWHAAAVAAGVALVLGTMWQVSPYGFRPGSYRTGIGEQRLLDLDDHSRITLDAATRVQVRYTNDARLIRLLDGQAQFSVSHDPVRPFKVQAGDHTVVALGTVFTVEYVDGKVHVTMMEGRVAVVPQEAGDSRDRSDGVFPQVGRQRNASGGPLNTAASTSAIELTAGQELRVGVDGHAIVNPKADVQAAAAWREGKVIFRTERLGDAVRRLNRYSRLQIEIVDEALAEKQISGVFEAGDTQGFVNAVQRYLPVSTEYAGTDAVRLHMS